VAARGLRHQALFYSGEDSFLGGTLPFVREGIEADEPVMAMLGREKTELLKSRLDGEADAVTFADMHELGRNPALIIPAWQEFVAQNTAAGRRVRGIGEPVWAERSHPEVVECQHHESLLNVAFADGPEIWLLCPYDTATLRPGVLRGACHSHPLIDDHGAVSESNSYREPEESGSPFNGPLSESPGDADALSFDSPDDLGTARQFVADRAAGEAIDDDRAEGLVLAVDELVTNSLRHGGGSGVLRAWQEDDDVVCEVADRGTISDPLVGRLHPSLDNAGGRGLWIANHFCDLLQIRSSRAGTVVRCRIGPLASDSLAYA
jgi:anti-sigma regulatory factor (Ser/Thr protein kinase)